MIIHQYVSKAVQDDAQLAGEQNRLLLEVRRARMPRRERAVSAAPARRLARLLLRRAPAYYSKALRDLGVRPARTQRSACQQSSQLKLPTGHTLRFRRGTISLRSPQLTHLARRQTPLLLVRRH
jgi:hypothetical protein